MPAKSVPLKPYRESGPGTDCDYSAQGNGAHLLVRIYVDPSSSVASALFAKLKSFYSFAGKPTQVPGLGEDAYFDAKHGLHVLKGQYRYFLSSTPTTPRRPMRNS